MSGGSGEDRLPEPNRPPDLWLPPVTGSPARPSAPTWRQPPGWAQPAPWQQPPAGAEPAPSAPRPAVRPTTLGWPAVPRTTLRFRHPVRSILLAVVFVPFVVLVVLSVLLTYGRGRPPSPSRPAPRAATIPSTWNVPAQQLRPDLPQAAYVSSLDGSFDQSFVREVGGLWLTMTGTQEAGAVEVHALDPGTGTVRWQRTLDGALCTTEAPKAGLLCASVLQRDGATRLGTRLQLHLLDPATGEDRVTRDVDGWFSAVHWSGSTFVALEQREPAPHAVIRGFRASDLADAWTRDLAREPGQDELFSENKVIRRQDDHPGIALDRPRFRDVGPGLLALWAGQRTAFLDPADGRLVMMPHCSRLVDDGTRLWCNEVDGATAYSYAGKQLVRVRGPRLAYPDDDGVGRDRNRAVFLDEDGAGVSVNPRTGDVGRPYTPPGRGSAFGNDTMPSAATVGEATFVVGGAGAMLLAPGADRVEWIDPTITVSDDPVLLGDDRVLLGAGDLAVLDLATGATKEHLRSDATYVVRVGDRVAGVGLDALSLLEP